MRLLAAAAAVGAASAAYTVTSSADVTDLTNNPYAAATVVGDINFVQNKFVKVAGLAANSKACLGDKDTVLKISNSAGVDVGSKVMLVAAQSASTACAYDFSLLTTDDVFTFETSSGNVKVALDRTAPVGTNYAAADVLFMGQKDKTISIPTSIFSDTLDTTSDLKITVTTETLTNSGFSVSPSALSYKLGAISLKATTVGSAGDYSVVLTAADRSGRTATSTVSFKIQAETAKPKPAILVSDARGGASGGSTGIWYTSSTSNPVYITLNFADEMVPGTVAFADTGIVVTADASNAASGRSFKYSLTKADMTTLTSIQVAAGSFTRKSDGVPMQESEEVTRTVPSPLMGTGTATAADYKAAVGADYWHYIPAGIFQNAVGEVTITSATSPQLGVGLYLQPGKLGRAAIVGKASVVPDSSTACGATTTQVVFTVTGVDASGKSATGTLCVPVVLHPGGTFTGLTSTAITAGEAEANVKVFATAPSATGLPSNACTSGTDCLNSVIAFLETPLTTNANKEYVEVTTGVRTAALSIAGGQPLLRSAISGANAALKLNNAGVVTVLGGMTYYNDNEDAVSTDVINKRTARVMVLNDGVLVGYAAKSVAYTVTNDQPVITLAMPGPIAAAESALAANAAGDEWLIFYKTAAPAGGIDIDDADDDGAVNGVGGAAIGSGFRSAVVAITSGCLSKDRLAIKTGATGMPALTYNYDVASCKLTIGPAANAKTISKNHLETFLNNVVFKSSTPTHPNTARSGAAEDRVIKLYVQDNASNGRVAAPFTKESAAITLSLTAAATVPVLVDSKAYGVGGIFYTSDRFANKKNGNVKMTAIKPATGSQKTRFSFNFNKISTGVYGGGGAIVYDDMVTASNSIAAANVGVTVLKAGGAAATGVSILNPNDGTTVEANLIAVAGTNPSLWGFDLQVASSADPGEYKFTFTYDSATFVVFFDIRGKACYVTGYDATTMYPDNTLCTGTDIDPTSITISAGGEENFGGKTMAEIEAWKLSANAANLASNRNLYRGAAHIVVPEKAMATSSLQVNFNAVPATAATKALLPVPTGAGVTVDSDVAVKLTPAGASFTTPVKVCILVGTVDTSAVRPVLAVASQIDATDASKGYSAWETLGQQSFDELTGQLCGTTTHFSVAAPLLVPVPVTPFQQKTYQMGASCPNACSGKGYCRELGQCVCFNGFTGYDCSQRTCPAEESWDVPADGSVAHKPAECSGRGACDRKAGTCVCYPGFEGAACDRVSCPSGCSGHGRCVLAKDLSNVNKDTYTTWEADRVQVCSCDAGYTGADCAQRVCPFGDDPETVCTDDKKQIQTITIDFGTLPGSATPGSTAFSHLYDNDELSLTFTTKDAHSFSTPTVGGIWEGTATVTDALQKALTSLPNFAVSDVAVTSNVDSTKVKVSYDVTFTGSSLVFNLLNSNNFGAVAASAVAGNTVSGDQNQLTCSKVGGFLTGCSGAGCRPKQKQPRLLEIQTTGTAFASINDNAILQQDAENAQGNNFDTAGVWGVSVAVTVKTVLGKSTYKYSVSTYGQSLKTSEEIPLPPDALRKNVAISHGLYLDFNTGSYAEDATGSTMVFNWRLPKCDVKVTQYASSEYEVSECSNRGTCDRKSGQCQCYAGYAGYNCGQQTIIV